MARIYIDVSRSPEGEEEPVEFVYAVNGYRQMVRLVRAVDEVERVGGRVTRKLVFEMEQVSKAEFLGMLESGKEGTGAEPAVEA